MAEVHYTYPKLQTQPPSIVEQLTKQMNKALSETFERATLAAIESVIAYVHAAGGRVTEEELKEYKRIVGTYIAKEHIRASNQDTPADGNRI